MRETLERLTAKLVSIFIFLLPWQAVYIFDERFISGIKSQYLSGVFYASEIILLSAVIISVFNLPKVGGLTNLRMKLLAPTLDKNHGRFIIALWLFIGWIGLTIFWSADKLPALYQFRFILEGAALLLIILNARISPNTIFTALCLSGILPALLACYQFVAQDIFAFKWLGLAAHSAADSGSIVIEAGGRWLRAYGPFNHPNILGGWLSLSLISGLILLARGKVNTNLRRAIIFLSPLLSAGIFFSFSRAAWLALLAGISMFICFERRNFRRKNMKSGGYYPAPQIFYSFIFLIILSATFSSLIFTRADSSNRLENISVSERASQFVQAKGAIFERPIFGTGLNNYTSSLHRSSPALDAYALQPVHNIYLLLFAELGLIGLLLFIFLIHSACRLLLANTTPLIHALPLLILLVIGLFDHYPVSSYVGIIAIFICLGAALADHSADLGEKRTAE